MLKRTIPIKREEWGPVLLATAYGFCILFSYYILRAVRDEISVEDRGNLQILWTFVFLVMLVAVPLYSHFVSKYSRGVFIPWANRFFGANLILFYLALEMLPLEARPWIDRVFYIWASVFALFVVAVFWGFVVDLFRDHQGKRVFGVIAMGSSLGGILGSFLITKIASLVPVFVLLLIAVVPLEIAAWIAWYLHRKAGEGQETLRVEGKKKIPGTAWSGVGLVFRSPYLRKIALYIFIMTFASTVLYFQQADLVGEAFTDRGIRREFLGSIDMYTNILTVFAQAFLAAHIIGWFGIGVTLAILPGIAALGFLGLRAFPNIEVLRIVQVLYRSGRYAVARPAREVLYTVVGREERYKSKAFIDAAVYRGGDLVNGWVYAGLGLLGLGVASIALISVPIMAVWMWIGVFLGRAQEEMSRANDPPT
ncbi:MAG: Npt1/Npt2 family nucleotide transporter [Gemmatimonadota bacterium]|jgi:AAA family ATP:ADP antiporter